MKSTDNGRGEPRINLHTHTFRCKHAVGTVDEYCRAAVAADVAVLGFTEHSPFPDGEYSGDRMAFAELPEYLRDIEAARRDYPQMLILSGLELDWRPALGKSFYENELIGRFGLDYVIAGAHSLPASGGRPALHIGKVPKPMPLPLLRAFVRETVEVMETGLLAYMAHPDLSAGGLWSWTPEVRSAYREIVDAAAALHVPLELNAYGLRKPMMDTPEGPRPRYPWRKFWELVAEHGGVEVVIGADAHRPEDVWSNMDDVFALAAELGLPTANREVAERIIRRRGERTRSAAEADVSRNGAKK